jgi:hypothetical protein
MAPYEALYGRRWRTPLFWSQTGESQVFGPEVSKDAEKQVQMVYESLKVAQSRQQIKEEEISHLKLEISYT